MLGSLTGPSWVVILAWMFAAVQLFGTTMVYCQPIFESFDAAYGNILVSLCIAATYDSPYQLWCKSASHACPASVKFQIYAMVATCGLLGCEGRRPQNGPYVFAAALSAAWIACIIARHHMWVHALVGPCVVHEEHYGPPGLQDNPDCARVLHRLPAPFLRRHHVSALSHTPAQPYFHTGSAPACCC